MIPSRIRGSWWLAARGASRLVREYHPWALASAIRRHGNSPLALLAATAHTHGDREAWVAADGTVTYAEVADRVRARAARLRRNLPFDPPTDPLTGVVQVLASMVAGRGVHLTTSGSTGPLIPVSQSTGWAATAQRLSLLGGLPVLRRPVVAGLAPTTRGHGLALVLSTWAMAGTYVWLDGPPPTHSADVVSGTPLQLREALAAGWLDGMTIGLVLSGSDVLPSDLVDAIAARTGAPVWDSYGATEVGSVTLATPGDVAVDTQGRVLSGVVVEVLDGKGRIVPRGVPGTLSITTRWSKAPFLDDRGLIDAQGRVVVLGRSDGQFNSGGVLVSTERLRQWLAEQPGVCSAHVRTTPDSRFDVRLVATFEGTADVEDLRRRCREELGAAHTPVRIERAERYRG